MLDRQFMSLKTINFFREDRICPQMLQINAASISHSVFVISTPPKKPIFRLERIKGYRKHRISIEKVQYDEDSWVLYSNIDKENMSYESLPKPTFRKAHK